ncbi:hypothetical protein BS78_04G285900 [Paspalum vaginatum]|nr:hypothetical protein BS78_04G285900 [Paspalum vaginatum]
MFTPRHGHALLLAALLASALATASAQQPYDDYGQVHVSTTMIALLAAVIAVFVFIAFFTVYLRHCTGYAVRSDDDRAMPNFDGFISRSRRQRRPRGLDAEVIEAFPTMKYAEAKALRVGKGCALECAVCLSEFEDEERLRFLPRCSHAFHPDCIGEWLASHVTCPVCRCNLDPNKDTSSGEEPIPLASSISSETAVARLGDGPLPVAAVVIDVVTEEEEEERRQEALELNQIGTQRRAIRSRTGRRPVAKQLARSHSTGHSLAVRLDRDMERFTLRLPEHVRREMVTAGEHSLQLRRGRRSGEGSSRGGRSVPPGQPGRWQSLLARTFSGKLSFFSASWMTVGSDGGAEVSSSSSTRARGKRVAAVDVADVPAKGSVRLDRVGGSTSGAKAGAAGREVAAAADEEKADTQQTFSKIPLKSHSVAEINEAVRRDNKQRFSLLEEDGELLIRANQGHTVTTVTSESLLKPILSADKVSVCVHGTYRKKLGSILQYGLKRMTRLHAHFSSGLPSDREVISGIRQNVNILIHLDVSKALQDGMKLYISENRVILTEGFDGVGPVKYFEKIETWPGRTPIPFQR